MFKSIELKKLTNHEEIKKLLNQVKKSADIFLIKDNGKPVAALVPPEDLDAIIDNDVEKTIDEIRRRRRAKKRFFELIDKAWEFNKDKSPEELEKIVEEAVKTAKKQELKELLEQS